MLSCAALNRFTACRNHRSCSSTPPNIHIEICTGSPGALSWLVVQPLANSAAHAQKNHIAIVRFTAVIVANALIAHNTGRARWTRLAVFLTNESQHSRPQKFGLRQAQPTVWPLTSNH